MLKQILHIFICSLFVCVTSVHAVQIKTIDKVDKDYQANAYNLMQNYATLDEVKLMNDKLASSKTFNNYKVELHKFKHNNQELEFAIYRPSDLVSTQTKLNVLFYTYGGGLLFDNAYYNYKRYQEYADKTNTAVVVPRYRLATQDPFPASLLDAYNVMLYVHDYADELNVNPSFVVIGDSAGGYLAAALSLYNRDHNKLDIRSQVLIYPMLDYKTGAKDSRFKAKFTGEILWTAQSNQLAWRTYAGEQEISPSDLAYFSPSYAQNFENLPNAFIYVGDLDLFVNEDLDYASKLIEGGVGVELHVIRGLYHVFEYGNFNAPKTRDMFQKIYTFVQDSFE